MIERRDGGKTKIVKKHETPTRAGGVMGGGVGLATGLVVALFPFAAVGGGLLVGTAAGGALLGAVAGHAAAGMSRHDLKELGEQLDSGQAGLVVVAVSDMGAKVEPAMKRAEKLEQKSIEADLDELQKDVESAGGGLLMDGPRAASGHVRRGDADRRRRAQPARRHRRAGEPGLPDGRAARREPHRLGMVRDRLRHRAGRDGRGRPAGELHPLWAGIVLAAVNAIAQLANAAQHPVWSIAIVVVDGLVIYGFTARAMQLGVETIEPERPQVDRVAR